VQGTLIVYILFCPAYRALLNDSDDAPFARHGREINVKTKSKMKQFFR
jgi:hypothetical protein